MQITRDSLFPATTVSLSSRVTFSNRPSSLSVHAEKSLLWFFTVAAHRLSLVELSSLAESPAAAEQTVCFLFTPHMPSVHERSRDVCFQSF